MPPAPLLPPALHNLQKKKTFPLTPALQNSVELSRHIMSSHEAKAHACLDLQGPLFSIQTCDIHCHSYRIPFFCFYFVNGQPIFTSLLNTNYKPSKLSPTPSTYRKVASRSTCYYSENQVFGGATNWDMSLTETCFYS